MLCPHVHALFSQSKSNDPTNTTHTVSYYLVLDHSMITLHRIPDSVITLTLTLIKYLSLGPVCIGKHSQLKTFQSGTGF